jgi:hypothetical protein
MKKSKEESVIDNKMEVKQRKYLTILSIIGIISAFLPWVSTIIGSLSGIDGDGIITLIMFALSLFMVLDINNKPSLVNKENELNLAKWLNVGIFGIMLWKVINISLLGMLGIGFWLTLFAALAGVIISFFPNKIWK